MRYIGPFFRMNSLSKDEISGQLFYLSKESVKTIVLNSKCGLLAPVPNSKKSSINDISILNNFSPLLCLYRKASPTFVHNKTSHGFDESTFKKEIFPSTNALMTLCLLELSQYYSYFNKGSRNITSLENSYKYLAKEQLRFYSENLRNAEGLFVPKKNLSEGNSKGYNLVDKDNKFKFTDQAFMMDAYYLYYLYNPDDEISNDYKNFSYEILGLFKDYKESLYELSFDENVQILFALNNFYKNSKSPTAHELILDLGDYLISKFNDKDYFNHSLANCALFSLTLMDAYKYTNIISFKDTSKEITDKLLSLYDSDKNIFFKPCDKKEIKYSCLDINFYLMNMIKHSNTFNKEKELKTAISSIFRRFYINGGLLTSWPEAPTLDEVERYKKLSLRSEDMLDETYFRMPVLPTPKSSGLASVFVKNLEYSKKKDAFTKSRNTFDSNKNMFNFFLIIDSFRKDVELTMELDISLNDSKSYTLKTSTDNLSDSNKSTDNSLNTDKHDPSTTNNSDHTTEEFNNEKVVQPDIQSAITLTGLSDTSSHNSSPKKGRVKKAKNTSCSNEKKS